MFCSHACHGKWRRAQPKATHRYHTCPWCDTQFIRSGKHVRFCSIDCKAAWQRTQRPISPDELYRLYIEQQLSTYSISKLVKRNPKRVYEWLRDDGVPTRKRGWSTEPGTRQWHKREWLEAEYVEKQKSATEISAEVGCTVNNILFFLHKHGIPVRQMSEIRAIKHWGNEGPANPMYGRIGPQNPNWKGGVSPERQGLYASEAWRKAARKVRKRDGNHCQRCGCIQELNRILCIHHRKSFAEHPEERVNVEFLISLCGPCHHWVHSNENVNHEFID